MDPEFIVHKLNLDPLFPPKKQKPRWTPKRHTEAVNEEVEKLKQVRVIKEVFYLEWLANTMMVKKKNRKWRVCFDFIDLNRVCLKDPYPVLKIDQLVDVTYSHSRMSFLNTFQGYHKIALAPEDQEKTSFISPEGNYHYMVMPFRLKNAGASYLWMVTRILRDKIGKIVEVYIDDMVVKSKEPKEQVQNLAKVFDILRHHKLRLNANKCAIGVGFGNFLEHMITCKGFEVSLNQIRAI